MNLILEKIVMNVKKIFNVVFSDIPEDRKIKMLENIIGEDLLTLNDYWDVFLYEFKVWRSNNIKSSNVKRMAYNDETRVLTVQFNDKSIYTYYNISFDTYMKISNGEYAPRTTGSNKYGSWKKGVRPSTGAGIWQALIDRGVRYERGGSFK